MYTLGVDIWTFESKGVLVDFAGRIVAQAARGHQMIVPRAGWAEHREFRARDADRCGVSAGGIRVRGQGWWGKGDMAMYYQGHPRGENRFSVDAGTMPGPGGGEADGAERHLVYGISTCRDGGAGAGWGGGDLAAPAAGSGVA